MATTTTTPCCVILGGPTPAVVENLRRVAARAASAAEEARKLAELRAELRELPTARLEALGRVAALAQLAPWYADAVRRELARRKSAASIETLRVRREAAEARRRAASPCDCRGFCGCP